MKRVLFVLLAGLALSTSTGCCCLDRMFCWGCNPCGSCGSSCGSGGCDSCGSGGGCSSGGCSDCGGGYGSYGGPVSSSGPYMAGGNPHPAHGHPLVHERRDAGGEYEFAAGPPTGGTTYPYYTNRGPRDYLARNPRDIGR